MSNIESYESAKGIIADIDSRKDSVLQALKIAANGYELYIEDMEHHKGCLADVLNDMFYEAEQKAKHIIEEYEYAQEREHRAVERQQFMLNVCRSLGMTV